MKEFFKEFYSNLGELVDMKEWLECEDKIIIELRVPIIIQAYMRYVHHIGLAGYVVNGSLAEFEENMFLDAFLHGLNHRIKNANP